MSKELIDLIEGAAQARGEMPVPREYIVLALTRIAEGAESVETYPLGSPSLKGAFDVAARLYAERAPQQ
ncbi:MAG: hypothetical protein AAB490_00830 [Patescibacteria group bacterium]